MLKTHRDLYINIFSARIFHELSANIAYVAHVFISSNFAQTIMRSLTLVILDPVDGFCFSSLILISLKSNFHSRLSNSCSYLQFLYSTSEITASNSNTPPATPALISPV